MSSENILGGGGGGGGGGGHAYTVWFGHAERNKFRRPRILIGRNILRSIFFFVVQMQPDKKLRALKIWRCTVVSSIQFAGCNIQYPRRVNAASQVYFAEVDILATRILNPRMENRRA